ncbi:MAG: 50S ribosomal protein L18 [SAR202 cluster bacterium Io17-Chloro-G7]|nr:MAG: 50S ribosomal protein L18 [SAR202 cluster bacterium Io17-Chloro-G7]
MSKDRNSRKYRVVRHLRVRKKVQGSGERPRLCVFRSLHHIYAQVIDDNTGRTLAAASSLEAAVGTDSESLPKLTVSQTVGKLVAERAKEKGISRVVFDRGGYKYHGRVKALAESSREAGLVF